MSTSTTTTIDRPSVAPIARSTLRADRAPQVRLAAGMPAPPFQVQGLRGEELSLERLRGSPVLLKFYRFATCPVCNLHMRGFIRRYAELGATGLRTLVFFHSPRARLEKTIETMLPFPVVPDPEKKVFRAYGVTHSLRGMFAPRVMQDYARALAAGFSPGMLSHDGGITGHPADFLLDGDGVIRLAHYGAHYADSLDTDAVLAALPLLRR
jgi:thioredoxin-dependent peroxiredoxin